MYPNPQCLDYVQVGDRYPSRRLVHRRVMVDHQSPPIVERPTSTVLPVSHGFGSIRMPIGWSDCDCVWTCYGGSLLVVVLAPANRNIHGSVGLSHCWFAGRRRGSVHRGIASRGRGLGVFTLRLVLGRCHSEGYASLACVADDAGCGWWIGGSWADLIVGRDSVLSYVAETLSTHQQIADTHTFAHELVPEHSTLQWRRSRHQVVRAVRGWWTALRRISLPLFATRPSFTCASRQRWSSRSHALVCYSGLM